MKEEQLLNIIQEIVEDKDIHALQKFQILTDWLYKTELTLLTQNKDAENYAALYKVITVLREKIDEL